MQAEDDINDMLDTVLEVKPGRPPYQVAATQLRDEIKPLADLVRDHRPRTILEIGTSQVGTFYLWNRYVESAELVVSLNLYQGPFGSGYTEKKTELFERFAPSTENVFVRTNSHDGATFEEVARTFEHGIDFLFADGDHTYEA